MVHEGYKPEMFDKGYNDIALIKFDLLEEKDMEKYKISPICLSSSIKDDKGKGDNSLSKQIIDQLLAGYSVGLGMEKQQTCLTNGNGPDIYQQCGKKTMYSYKGTVSLSFLLVSMSPSRKSH